MAREIRKIQAWGYKIFVADLAKVAMGDGNIYEKAREYAKDFTQLLLAITAVRCAKKGAAKAKDIFTNKSDIKSIFKRKGSTPAEEVLKNQAEMEILLPETQQELLASYKSLLEDDAVKAYEREILQYSLEKGREIKETIQMVSEKLERKLTQNELAKILRWLNEGEMPEMVCIRFIVPSLPEGSLPEGNYAAGDRPGYKRQNEAADLIASKGYRLVMLEEVKDGGNGYGIKPNTNPDFLIENNVFDCYAPEKDTKMKTISNKIYTKTISQAQNIVLNLNDYDGDTIEHIDYLKQRANPKGDLKHLEKLWVIKDGRITKVID